MYNSGLPRTNIGGTYGNLDSGGVVPWVNFGAVLEQIQGKDADVFPGMVFPGGVRGGSGSQTQAPSSPSAGQLNTVEQPSGPYAGSGAYGGGGVSSANIAADRAYLDDQMARLQRQKQSADAAERSGLTQLNDSYNREVGGANQQRSRALEDFSLKREDTTRGRDTALNRVDTNARTLADSLRRRIGMASGSGSSAYQYAAPGAVAKQATEQRTGVQENYGVNFRNLGQAEERAKVDFDSLLQDLAAQRGQRESDFKSGILDRRNQIDNSLAEIARQRALLGGGGYNQVRQAMAPYSSAIDARQGEIDSLFDRYRTPFNVKPVEVHTPSLRDYLVDRASISADQIRNADPSNPLRPRDDEEPAALY